MTVVPAFVADSTSFGPLFGNTLASFYVDLCEYLLI